MHIFPAVIGNLQSDVMDDVEVQRDWDFPFIHVYSKSGCFEASVKMVYCAAFGCNENSSENRVTSSSLKCLSHPTLLKKNGSRK